MAKFEEWGAIVIAAATFGGFIAHALLTGAAA